jgi:predicted acetyltransferase
VTPPARVDVVHPVPVEAAESWVRAYVTTLLGDPYSDEFAKVLPRWTRDWRADRTWGAVDRGRWVATLVTDPRTLTVPGAGVSTNDIEADALTAVTVAATHRRRGLLRAMLTQSLQAAKDRGDAVSILVAAEWPIYGRFGYAPATVLTEQRLLTRQAGGVTGADPSRIRQVERDELGPIADEIFDRARRRRPGQVDRRAPWWDRRLAQDGYGQRGRVLNWFVHDGPDGPDGIVAWKPKREFELNGPHGSIEVGELVAATDDAYCDIWGYLCGIDIIDEVGVWGCSTDEPIRWLLRDGRALKQVDSHDMLWLRLLDVPVALAARGYPTDARVVLDVTDTDIGGYAAGRYELVTKASGATCRLTVEPADLRLSQRTLASIYLGGHRLHALLDDGTEELTAGSLDLVDLLFSTPLAPVTQTSF